MNTIQMIIELDKALCIKGLFLLAIFLLCTQNVCYMCDFYYQ